MDGGFTGGTKLGSPLVEGMGANSSISLIDVSKGFSKSHKNDS
jgi:hypothetical protein